jgi:hypothetical protein
MKFICPTCGEALERELLIIIPHTEKHIVDEIKYYKKELRQD